MPPPAPPSPVGTGWAGTSSVSTEGEYHRHPAPGDEKYDAAELRGRPYGLGPRVPLYVISPWSRGGWVDSQIYDHTSVIRLIERRFGVAAPDISPWRRAVCGDLSNAFDFAQRDTRPFVRGLPDVSAVAARAAALPGRTVPALPEGLKPAKQESGVRPARALPYRPQASLAAVDASGVDLTLSCDGAAAVLHVYDRLRLEAVPAATLVPACRCASAGRWTPRVAMTCGCLGRTASIVTSRVRPGRLPCRRRLITRMANCGCTCATWRTTHSRCACRLAPMPGTCQSRCWHCRRARKRRWPGTRHPRQAGTTCASARVRVLRLAGRAEDGRPATSDPAMGTEPLRFEHD